MRWFLILNLCFGTLCQQGQDLKRYNPMKAEPLGGSIQLEQVVETQLSFPKNFFQSGYRDDLNVYFTIDSAGKADKVTVQGNLNNKVAKKEVARLLRFMSFLRHDSDPEVPYHLVIPISKEKYNSYRKQKFRGNLKTNKPADSSYVIYSKADRSPEYYKDGEEGLKTFLMENLEYPKVAIEKGVEGTVILEFVVETNGFITGIKARQMLGATCTDEAIRLLRQTRWRPAELNGKYVRYRMSYPITFSLRHVNRDTGMPGSAVGQ